MYDRIHNVLFERAAPLVDRLLPTLHAVRAAIRSAPAPLRFGLACCVVLALVAAVVIGATWVSGPTAAESDLPWRYLVICDACGQREQVAVRPGPPASDICKRCGKGRVSIYRRGSQALAPGGWSSSQPATAPTQVQVQP